MAIFAHRGIVNADISENSLESLENAIYLGFLGIEFDIWYWQNELIISHDKPCKNLLTLQSFLLCSLATSKNPMLYWLDFKNVNLDNCLDIAIQTKKIFTFCQVPEQNIFLAPFVTDYNLSQQIFFNWQKVFGKNINFMAVCEHQHQLQECLHFIRCNNISHLSINKTLLNQQNIELIQQYCQIFAWTIKDKQDYFALQKLGIKNFATDICL
jgi:glycerophosphoryl diester phosphodiesterase